MGAAVTFVVRNCSNILYRLRPEDRTATRFFEKGPKNTCEGNGDCETQADKVEIVDMAKRNIGSNFDDFLDEEGLLEDVTAIAVKRYISHQLAEKMSETKLSKAEMARRMDTSRSALDRLLDPENSSVTLQTLQSAVQALGGRLKIELEFHEHAA